MMVLIGSMAVVGQAQNNGRPQLVAEIPFQFNVGNKTLPAGEYLVRSISDDSPTVVLNIQSRDGNASAMLIMRSVEGRAANSAKLLFNRYGNQYFFAQMWVDGEKLGLEAPRSRTERAAQLELARIKPTAEMVAVKRR